MTTAPYKRQTIAGQCCEADGTCRRWTAAGVEKVCIAGHSRASTAGYVEEMTYADVVVKCRQLGLELCRASCAQRRV